MYTCQDVKTCLSFSIFPSRDRQKSLSLIEMPACFERQHFRPLTFLPHSKEHSVPSRPMMTLETPLDPPIGHPKNRI